MALGQYCSVLQIAGYQNSGKTTLMEKIIKRAASEGLTVASIKHHGHGGAPDTAEGKDSTLHQQAGATVAGVEGGGVLDLSIIRDSWSLQDILKIYQAFKVDVIFIEGFKREAYPKVVLLRREEDLPLLDLSNIQCVITWTNLEMKTDYPVFPLEAEKEYIEFLLQIVREQNGNKPF